MTVATIEINEVDYTYEDSTQGSNSGSGVETVPITNPDNDNLVDGRNGDDSISGGNGDDILIGANGSDTLSGGAGDDVLVGGSLQNETGNNPQNDGGYDIINSQSQSDTFLFGFEYEVGGQTTVTTTYDLSPPGANADWKAWENYNNRLLWFFEEGGLEQLVAEGYDFGDEDALKAQWAAYKTDVLGNPDASDITSGDVHVISGKKAANTWGNDTPIHDIVNNLNLWEAMTPGSNPTQTNAAAFLKFAAITGEKTEVVEGSGTATATSGDGHDQVLDFDWAGGNKDELSLSGLAGIEADDFYDLFDVAQSGNQIVVSLEDGTWSVTLVVDDSVTGVTEAVFYAKAVADGWFT